MTDLRDLIARAIFLVDYMSMGEESWETAALDGNDDRRQAFEKADAVLAVLRDLPADVIGEAADGGVVERFTLGEIKARILGRLTKTGYGEHVLVDDVCDLIDQYAQEVSNDD